MGEEKTESGTETTEALLKEWARRAIWIPSTRRLRPLAKNVNG